MSEADNIEVTRRFSAEVWGEGNVALADELIAPDLVEHTPFPAPTPGLEGHKQVLAMFRAAFPDLKVTVDDVIAEGDLTYLSWHGDGTHTGADDGHPARPASTVHVTGHGHSQAGKRQNQGALGGDQRVRADAAAWRDSERVGQCLCSSSSLPVLPGGANCSRRWGSTSASSNRTLTRRSTAGEDPYAYVRRLSIEKAEAVAAD